MAATPELLVTAGPARLDRVRVIRVDQHRWTHTRHAASDGFVIVDLTPVVEQGRRARLLDLVEDCSAAALTGWLVERAPAFRDRIQIVIMDGFGGYKNAATSTGPDAVTRDGPRSTSSTWPERSRICAANASSRTRPAAAAGPGCTAHTEANSVKRGATSVA